jgi:hypothetical protein
MSGVQLHQPPSELRAAINAKAREAIGTLPPTANGAFVGIATEAGWNLAVLARVGDRIDVAGYVGKSWGAPLDVGAQVRIVSSSRNSLSRSLSSADSRVSARRALSPRTATSCASRSRT